MAPTSHSESKWFGKTLDRRTIIFILIIVLVPLTVLVGGFLVWAFFGQTYDLDEPYPLHAANVDLELDRSRMHLSVWREVDDKPKIAGELAVISFWEFEKDLFPEAKQHATEALAIASPNRRAWGFDASRALHYSHITLGKLALREGDIESAKQHLIDSANIPWSDVMRLLGPDMSFAKELLEKGETEAVLEYMDECDDWWEANGRWKSWKREIHDGKAPNFGMNLSPKYMY